MTKYTALTQKLENGKTLVRLSAYRGNSSEFGPIYQGVFRESLSPDGWEFIKGLLAGDVTERELMPEPSVIAGLGTLG